LAKYRAIWNFDSNSSPLIHYTCEQAKAIQQQLMLPNTIVDYAFCYSTPDISTTLNKLHNEKVDRLVVLPLYPQFSTTTTMPVFDMIAKFYTDKNYLPAIHFIRDFALDSGYINAIVDSIKKSFLDNGDPDKLILSYHSLPQQIIDDGDSYHTECLLTSAKIIELLGLGTDDYIVTFQSKFGRQKWLTPATAKVVEELALANTKHIAVVCPGFISDCLETLEEINMMNREIFISNGGQKYNYIPCLNANADTIMFLTNLLKTNLTQTL